jgi:hypothetical protein
MDELGYLRDGLRDTSLSARRSRYVWSGLCIYFCMHQFGFLVRNANSAIDILSKCAGVAWFERLRICGQVEPIYEEFATAGKGESDEVGGVLVDNRVDNGCLTFVRHSGARSRAPDVSGASIAVNKRPRGHRCESCKRGLRIPPQ